MVECKWIGDKEEGPACKAIQAGAAVAVTGRREGVEEGGKEAVRLLAFWANTIADWADRMPLRNVYIFGDRGLGEVASVGKLKIAIEFNDNVCDQIMRSWQRENSTDFAELEQALGIETEFYTDQDYDVWPPIRDAARTPVMTVRKVKVVQHLHF